ncbi:MAG: PAS-domain containing protein [Alphaproteobacteria bacterium]|nr:PAS-domain containing protein [Alphaproteobacteria bacterium]
MRELLERQLLDARGGVADGPLDVAAFADAVARTYETLDRERRLAAENAAEKTRELESATVQLRAESAEALSSAERRFLDAIEIGPGPLMVLDSELNFVAWNTAAARVLGRASSRLGVGLPLVGCARGLIENGDIKAPPEHAEAWVKISIDNVRDASWPLEIKVAGRWYQQRSRRLLDGGYLNAWIDITDLKVREKELAAAKAAAESANQLKSQFLATMSHELRTPLNAILGFAETIRDQVFGPNATDKYVEYAHDIHRSGQHLHALICDILDLSKIEAGSYELAIETVNAVEEAKGCMAMITTLAEKGGVTVSFAAAAPSLLIDCDMRALRQVLLNLLSNAVKFTPSGGCIEANAVAENGALVITIADTGIGISPEKLATLFQPFRQGDAGTSRRYEGTGLGLYISKRLVELHKGAIRLESAPGQGTRAIVTLPSKHIAGEAARAAG